MIKKKNSILIESTHMCNCPFPETTEAMNYTDFHNKAKRFRLFEPSTGVLGIIVCVILCFFWLDYRNVAKGLSFPADNERFMWLRIDGDGMGGGVKKTDFLSGGCDLFDGDWVWDESYPLYQSRDCRFIDEGFRCSEYGRPDFNYTKWRWQPKHCNLPRFNAKVLLEKLRNKRVVFAGDSIGRNQWESLLCMLSSAVPNKDSTIFEANSRPITKHKGFLIFKFADYNCTVEYYRAPFLVLQSRRPHNAPSNVKTTLNLDRMDWSSSKWKDADVLVLNTGHWWNYEKTVRGGCYFQKGSEVKMNMTVDHAYETSLETVLTWINRKVNSNKTQVFFRTYAPVHFRGGDWRSGGTCHLETLPQLDNSFIPSDTWKQFSILNRVIARNPNTKSLDILNITHMSSRRKDGHSSLYYLGPKSPAPIHRQDCSHWCLPGVPDAWNELLYALVLKREAIKISNSSTLHAQV